MSGYRTASVVVGFITPLLGSVIDRERHTGKFQRSPDGEVVLMPGWWNKSFDFGAKSMGKFQRIVRNVKVDPTVKGPVGYYRRYLSDDPVGYIDHECFDRFMLVNMRLPAEIGFEDMAEILNEGGRYVGLAPQQWAENFGRFRLVDIGDGGLECPE